MFIFILFVFAFMEVNVGLRVLAFLSLFCFLVCNEAQRCFCILRILVCETTYFFTKHSICLQII